MKIFQVIFLAAIGLALAACTDKQAQERAINEGSAAPAQVAAAAQDAEPGFAATCREVGGRWDGKQNLCFVTEAACSASAGEWEPAIGCVLKTPEAECDERIGMVFENARCILKTVSPEAFEVK